MTDCGSGGGLIDIITATVNATGTARRVAVLVMRRFAVHCGRGVLVALPYIAGFSFGVA